MEKSKNVIMQTFNTNNYLIGKALDGLTEEHFSTQPNKSTNPIHFLLGHLTLYRFQGCKLLGEEMTYKFSEFYKPGNPIQERSKYPTTAEIKAEWNMVTERLKTLLESSSLDIFEKEIPSKYPIGEQNVMGAFQFLMFHEAYHLGQISLVRKYFGYEGII